MKPHARTWKGSRKENRFRRQEILCLCKFKICVGLLAFFYVNVVKFQNFKFEWFC